MPHKLKLLSRPNRKLRNAKQKDRTAKNKDKKKNRINLVEENPSTIQEACECGAVVKIRKYHVVKPYKCAKCRGLIITNEVKRQANRT